jgi:prevent-host-death family protein
VSSWQLQTAKSRFSELVKRALAEGPQDITVHGRAAVVVISRENFERLTKSKPSLAQFVRQSPLSGALSKLERSKSPARVAEL